MSPADRIFPDGEMVERVREQRILDPMSPTTRAAVTVCFASPAPMLMWWGPAMSLVYNDAAIPVLGNAHPTALGRTVPDGDDERWRSIRSDLDRVAAVRSAVTTPDFKLSPIIEDDTVIAIVGTPLTQPGDQALAVVGHELRNPLSTVATMAQVLLLRGPTPEVQAIERAIRRVSNILDDVQDSSRLARNKVVLDRTVIELADAVQSSIAYAAPVLDEKRHYVSVRVARSGFRIYADLDRLSRAIANVLADVAQHSISGQTITIAATRGIDHVTLQIVDENARRPQANASAGLGLAIARTIIERHGGTIAVRHAADFELTLPSTDEAVKTAPPVRAARMRLLLVEDNDDNARALKSALEQLGYEVALAHDAPIALIVARTFRPDVALLDLGLPVMDGWELAKRLNEGRSGLPVIAVTARDQAEDRQRSAELGFAGHLVKPIDLPQLQKLVETLGVSRSS